MRRLVGIIFVGLAAWFTAYVIVEFARFTANAYHLISGS